VIIFGWKNQHTSNKLHTHIPLSQYLQNGSIVQWLGRQSLVGKLSQSCDRSIVDRWPCGQMVHYGSDNYGRETIKWHTRRMAVQLQDKVHEQRHGLQTRLYTCSVCLQCVACGYASFQIWGHQTFQTYQFSKTFNCSEKNTTVQKLSPSVNWKCINYTVRDSASGQ